MPSLSSTLLTIFFIISLLMNGGFRPLIKRGFFCNDTTIRYPIKSDTVSFKMLLVVALVIPSIVIFFLERKLNKLTEQRNHKHGLRSRKDSDKICQNEQDEVEGLMQSIDRRKRRMVINGDIDSDIDEETEPGNVLCDNSDDDRKGVTSNSIPHGGQSDIAFAGTTRCLKRAAMGKLSDLQLFLFGFTTTAFLTGVGKTASGRLRPHFMARCKPNVDCAAQDNLYRYIEDFECTDETMRPRDYSYITTSWPSGEFATGYWFTMCCEMLPVLNLSVNL
jgi:hypothetical protein